jgi:hypothetical protein
VAELTSWTEAYGLSQKIKGLDHLGLESTAENIYDLATPGFTNNAKRARYYALYCWILYDYANGGYLREDFKPFFRRREYAYALACLSHEHRAGAVGDVSIMGRRRAGKRWRSGDDPVDLSESHMDSPYGGYGLYYRNAMQRAGLTYVEGTQDQLTEIRSRGPSGRALAEAFQRVVEDTEYFRHYRDRYEVPRSVLEEYGRAACVCGMADHDDGEVLRRALLQTAPPEPDALVRDMHLARSRTLTLIFDALSSCDGERLDDAAWRRLMFYRTFADGRHYEAPGSLTEGARIWRMYQQREYHVYAVTSLWAELLKWLRSRREAVLEEWIVELSSRVNPKQTGDRFGLSLNEGDISQVTVEEMLDSVAKAGGAQTGFDTVPVGRLEEGISRDHPASEAAIHRALERGTLFDLGEHVGGALWLSLVLFARTRGWLAENPANATLARMGGPEHWSVWTFFHEIDRRREQSVLAYLAWLYRSLVRQHLVVAMSKMPRVDTFMLLYEDGTLEYRPSDTIDSAQFTGDRYDAMLTVCRDLGWIRESGGSLQLTPLGSTDRSEALGALT